MTAPRLYQFAYSPYCEKVRWALDYKAIPWWRENLLPGPHLPRVLSLTGQRYVPILVLDGRRIHDSTRIIEAIEALRPEPALIPSSPDERRHAIRLEDFCDETLGPPLKRLSYAPLLSNPAFCAHLMSRGRGTAARRAYALTFPAVARGLRTGMGLSERRLEKAASALDTALDRLESEIDPTGYLVGGAFSLADLAAASMLSPLLPPPFSPFLPQAAAPDEIVRWRARYADRPAVAWAQRIYADHRGTTFAENGEHRGSAVI